MHDHAWAERPVEQLVIVVGRPVQTSELYAAKVTVREVDGSPCEAEAHLNEVERPAAWSHDCGCEPREVPTCADLGCETAFCSSPDTCTCDGDACSLSN